MPESIITADSVAAAEAQLQAIKEQTEPGDPERVRAMQAVADLRMLYRAQEENDPNSERQPGHGIVTQDNDGTAEEGGK